MPRLLPGRRAPLRLEALEVRTTPASFAEAPVVPELSAEDAGYLRGVFARGQYLGLRGNVFAKGGDSLTHAPEAFAPLASPAVNAGTLGAHAGLAAALEFFRSTPADGTTSSFNRGSSAVFAGWLSHQVLERLPGELAATRPAFALIMVGTNDAFAGIDVGAYAGRLRAIVETCLNFGTVPVLSTVPELPLLGASGPQRVAAINQTIADVAEAERVPLWNFWRATSVLPFGGIGDGLHPNVSPNGPTDFSPAGLSFGHNVRNLTALQVLDSLKTRIVEGRDPPGLQAAPAKPWNAPVIGDVVTGSDDGTLRVFSKTGQLRTEAVPFADWRGAVTGTLADVPLDGRPADGVPDLIAAVGVGGGPLVRVLDGVTGRPAATLSAMDVQFRGGLNVAAGDLDGDGGAEIVVAPARGGGPRVQVLRTDGGRGGDFFAYGADYTGGVDVAVGDTDGDGRGEIITTPVRGSSHARVFGGDGSDRGSFFAFAGPLGASVAAGDLDGDGKAELVFGTGDGGGPRLRVVGREEFFAFDPGLRGGVNVAVSGGVLYAAPGVGGAPGVRAFEGGSPDVGVGFFALDTDERSGVFVG